jgi:hypothetical protein
MTLSGVSLQDLKYNDIRLYVDEKFDAYDMMTDLSKQAPSEARRLVEEVVMGADGIFLWVKLVVRPLLDDILNEDRIIELQQRLNEILSGLETLYVYSLATIHPRYFLEGC